MKKEVGQLVTAIIAILFGIFAIFTFVPDATLLLIFLSLTFGVLAIIWAGHAKASFSPGTTLGQYTGVFLTSLVALFIVTVVELFEFLLQLTGAIVYVKFGLISLSYLLFAISSYKILSIGNIFGFKSQVTRMGNHKGAKVARASAKRKPASKSAKSKRKAKSKTSKRK